MNINIGPGDTSWLSTPEEYWPALDELCKKNRVNYLEDPWWPAIDELIDAGIPVHRYIQRPGDIGKRHKSSFLLFIFHGVIMKLLLDQ